MSLTPTQKKKVRDSITASCKTLIANEPDVHYEQTRPFPFYNDLSKRLILDCSATVGNIFWNAQHDLAIFLHDPLDERYSGWGNTSTMESYLRAKGKKITTQGFLSGDICRVGTGRSSHVVVCFAAGSKETAKWCSHGWEGGPVQVQLATYRVSEFIGVWRHPALV